MENRKCLHIFRLLLCVNIIVVKTTFANKINFTVAQNDQYFSNSSIKCAFETLPIEDGDYLTCRQNYDNLNGNVPYAFDAVSHEALRTLSNVSKLTFVNMDFDNFNLSIFDDVLLNETSRIEHLKVKNCRFFGNVVFSTNARKAWENLRILEISGNRIDGAVIFADNFRLDSIMPNLHTLRFTGNKLNRWALLTATTNASSETVISESLSLERIDFRDNDLRFVPRLPSRLLALEIMGNSISRLENGSFDEATSLKLLNISFNSLTEITIDSLSKLTELETLDLSNNLISRLETNSFRFLTNLKELLLSNNPLKVLPRRFPVGLSNLRLIDLSQTDVRVLLLETFAELTGLKTLKVDNSQHLRSIVGAIVRHAPTLRELSAKNCSLKTLPEDIFRDADKLVSVDLSENPWPCDCRLLWADRLSPVLKFVNKNVTFCWTTNNDKFQVDNFTQSLLNVSQCNLGTIYKNGTIVRVRYGQSALLDCGAYGRPWPNVKWQRVDTPVDMKSIVDQEQIDDAQPIEYPDGTLSVKAVYKDEVGLYRCSIDNDLGNATLYVKLRLAYKETWWFIKICSLICGILTALAFFALNAIYGALRRLFVWRLSKLEQTSRVRCLLESLEKYRTRQMDYLHEIYSSNMNQVRENYHQQVDQLRKSYASQAERFRDYRTQQFETVAQHIDSMRDNYASQMNRMRDYGSRQMERLWESYQNRVGRLRDFSLQQRLRLMQHYKIKQQYLNKVLENLNMESCRHAAGGQRRPNRNVIGPESIELPSMMPDDDDDDAPMSSRAVDNFLVGVSTQSYLDDFSDDPTMVRASNNFRDAFDDDDASSYHSFPEDITFYTEDENNVSVNKTNGTLLQQNVSSHGEQEVVVHSPKFTKETAL